MNRLFDNIYFEYMISLGHNCTISNSLIDISARGYSYPFDWTLTHVDYLIECFDTKFNNFFEKKYLSMSGKGTNHAAKYKDLITFVHAGHYNSLMNDTEYYNLQKNNYLRRINRLYNNLNSKINILFLIDDYYLTVENLSKLIDTIKSNDFIANIKILVFCSNNNDLLKINEKYNDYCFVKNLNNVERFSISDFIKNNINYKTYPKIQKNKQIYFD